MTSHAAVVARAWARRASPAPAIRIDYAARTLTAGNTVLNEGDTITIDGSNGQVLKGEVLKIQPELTGDFGKLMAWVDEIRKLGARQRRDAVGCVDRAQLRLRGSACAAPSTCSSIRSGSSTCAR